MKDLDLLTQGGVGCHADRKEAEGPHITIVPILRLIQLVQEMRLLLHEKEKGNINIT